MDLLFLVAGVALLAVGGEALMRGALAAAARLQVSPLLSGLLIVGFGTSVPELVVSVHAAVAGQPGIAVGNVVGSNIGNVLLILGVCALIAPLAVKPTALRRDAVAVVAASLVFVVLAAGGSLARTDGGILCVGLAAYLVWTYRSERSHAAPSAEMHAAEATELQALPRSIPWILIGTVAGLALLIGGSQILLVGAMGISAQLGVPETVVGLTLVAVGTSLPELSISVVATLRGHADVAVGNVLGSNIFNLLGILGVSGLLQPLPLPARIVAFDQWVMLATAVLLLVFLYTGRRLSRLEGGALVGAYVAYLWAAFAAARLS